MLTNLWIYTTNMNEITYINNGLTYKAQTNIKDHAKIANKSILNAMSSSTGVDSVYYVDSIQTPEMSSKVDALINIESQKTDADGVVWTKTYKSTSQFRELIGVKGGLDINSISVDLCPSVEVWGGIGEVTGKAQDEFIELYFNVTSSKNMQDIADFYGLPNPLATDNDLDANRHNWTLREYPNGVDLVLGSVVFKDKVQILLKIYKYEKD